jgi:hypothetical protein
LRWVERHVPAGRPVAWIDPGVGFSPGMLLRCPRCERRMRVLSTITDSAVVRRILDHLNLPSQPRTAAPARDPTWEPMAFGFDAA